MESDRIDLPNGSQLRALGDGSYRYLSQLESDGVLYQECKERLGVSTRPGQEVFKLDGGNMVRAVNKWAVSLVRYSAGIVKWT